jgi:hypothetical protein
MYNVQNCDSYINIPSSQTYRTLNVTFNALRCLASIWSSFWSGGLQMNANYYWKGHFRLECRCRVHVETTDVFTLLAVRQDNITPHPVAVSVAAERSVWVKITISEENPCFLPRKLILTRGYSNSTVVWLNISKVGTLRLWSHLFPNMPPRNFRKVLKISLRPDWVDVI